MPLGMRLSVSAPPSLRAQRRSSAKNFGSWFRSVGRLYASPNSAPTSAAMAPRSAIGRFPLYAGRFDDVQLLERDRRTRPVIVAWPRASGADLFSHRNERCRSDLRERRVVPARKRFEAADPASRQGDNRREDNADLRFGDRPTWCILRRGAADGAAFHRRPIEGGYSAASDRLGAVERGVGEAHQFLRLGG